MDESGIRCLNWFWIWQHRPESGSIPLRNWIFLLIPSPIPELELNWNWLYSVQAELELNWNCHHWNWSRNCFLRNWIRNCLHGIEIPYEVPHISVAYYSRRLAQVVYTLLVHIDSTKETRGQLCNCSHNNDTVGSYQPFHDQIGHGLTITGQWCFLREAKSHQPFDNYIIPSWIAFFVWPAGWPTAAHNSVHLFIYLFIMSYLPRSTPSVRSTVLPGAPAYMHDKTNINQHTFSYNTVTTLTTWYIHHYIIIHA